jgi:threonine dehydrogenase-like Zn-dependent dehydrogenase
MPHAIRFHQPGGPEVLKWEEVAVGDPGPNEARVRHHAVGLNFIDIYHRTGAYPLPLPSGIGLEGAGVVEAVGSEVKDLKAGDRVAYAGGPVGAYAEVRLIPADRLVKLPEALSFEQGAAMMLQGMTAQYLLRRTYRVQPGDTILIHAAAGGVGLIVCQWAKALGAKVIGTVGSDEKAALAKAHGCDHPIVYTREKFAERVKESPRRGRGGGVRLHRPRHFHGFAVVPAAHGHDGAVRRRLWPGAALRPRPAGEDGRAVHHPADAVCLYGKTQRPRADGGRTVRHGHLGQGEDRGQPALRPEGRGEGAGGSGGAQDHRLDRPAALRTQRTSCSIRRPACTARSWARY